MGEQEPTRTDWWSAEATDALSSTPPATDLFAAAICSRWIFLPLSSFLSPAPISRTRCPTSAYVKYCQSPSSRVSITWAMIFRWARHRFSPCVSTAHEKSAAGVSRPSSWDIGAARSCEKRMMGLSLSGVEGRLKDLKRSAIEQEEWEVRRGWEEARGREEGNGCAGRGRLRYARGRNGLGPDATSTAG